MTNEAESLADELHEYVAAAPPDVPKYLCGLIERAEKAIRAAARPSPDAGLVNAETWPAINRAASGLLTEYRQSTPSSERIACMENYAYWCAVVASTRAVAGEPVAPTEAQTNSACMSYRHDFGLLSIEARARERFTALEWLKAWQKEGFALASPATQLTEER